MRISNDDSDMKPVVKTHKQGKRLFDVAIGNKDNAKRARRGVDETGKYSLMLEAREAKKEFSENMSNGAVNGGKAIAVAKFSGHVLHMILRFIWRVLIVIAVIGIVCLLAGGVGLGALYFSSASELPNIDDYTKVSMPQDSTIYDVDGKVIGVVSTVSRDSVGFGEISQPMKDAIVAIEDERFYNHQGIDFQGIARALYVNYREWRSGGDSDSQGASTITQQYVRNAYKEVGTQRTLNRKMTEMMLAAQLEAEMSKDDILNSYLNTVYFGNGCYGVEAASKHYFNHSADTLDYYESAVLAAIVNGPSIYDPETDEGREKTEERVNLVLDKMYSLGKLGDMTQDELRDLKTTTLDSKLDITEEKQEINQPYYYDYVMKEVADQYSTEDIESGGWQIYTTLSIADGQAAQEVVEGVNKRYAGSGITGAIVDIDNATGAVHAFCGGTNYSESQYNIATDGHLQTGSTLKPIVYAGLCEYKGWYMSDSISAEPVNVGTDDDPHMITPYVKTKTATLKQGIVASDNAVTIHVAQEEGMDNVKKMVKAVGIDTELEDNVIATIGGQTNGLTPLELASGYSTIERGGQMKKHWCVTQITDGLGNLVYQHEDTNEYAMSREVSLQVIDAMKSAVDDAGWYNIPFDKQGWTIAAKTGTTNDDMDSWCVGFDHDRTVAIWVGGKDAKVTVRNSSHNTTGSFSEYFEKVGQGDSKDDWDEPQYKTEVPQIQEGQSLDDYTSTVESKQLKVRIDYVSSSNDDNDGSVLGVSNAGELVDRGDAAIVRVARDMVAVPDFDGMTPSQAYANANGLDLSWDVKYSKNGSSDPKITKQSVDSGKVVPKGTEVSLTITMLVSDSSSSPTIQQVPENGTDSALSMLYNERNALKSQNDQLSQQLEELRGQQEQNDSDEQEMLTVPDVSDMTARDARKVMSSIGLNAAYTGNETDTISSTSPSAGSSVAKGSTVTLNGSSSQSSQSSRSSRSNGSQSSNTGTSTRQYRSTR